MTTDLIDSEISISKADGERAMCDCGAYDSETDERETVQTEVLGGFMSFWLALWLSSREETPPRAKFGVCVTSPSQRDREILNDATRRHERLN